MPHFLVVSCSHNPASRSRVLARLAHARLEALGAEAEFIDISTLELPMCDGDATYANPRVIALSAQISAANGVIVASAIYNYDVNAAAKNLLELTGAAWRGKVVGFICAAGGHGSYMSVMPFANSLMLDFRCMILPRYVYAPPAEVAGEDFASGALAGRIEDLAREMIRVTTGLATS